MLNKIEAGSLIFSLALALTFVPMLVSAASTVLNLAGVAISVALGIWIYQFVKRIMNNTSN